jgi:hypothetical protein
MTAGIRRSKVRRASADTTRWFWLAAVACLALVGPVSGDDPAASQPAQTVAQAAALAREWVTAPTR